MLVGVEGLLEDIVSGEDHDDGEVLVNEGENTVLQLTRHDGFAVKVGNFLDLKSTLEGGRELETTAKKQERLLVLEDPTAEILDSSILLKDIPNLAGDLGKALHNFLSPLSLGRAILTK